MIVQFNKANSEDIENISQEKCISIIERYKKYFHVEYKYNKLPLTQADIKINLLNPWLIVR